MTTHLKATSHLSHFLLFSFHLGGGETSSHHECEWKEDLAYVLLGREGVCG
jgi:hypothetical protein